MIVKLSTVLSAIIWTTTLLDAGSGVLATFGNEYVHIKLHVPKTAAKNAHSNLHKLEDVARPKHAAGPKVIHKVIHHHHHHPAQSHGSHTSHHSTHTRHGPSSHSHRPAPAHHHNHLLDSVVVTEVKDLSNVNRDHLDYLSHASDIAKHVAPHLQAERPKHSFVDAYAIVEAKPPPSTGHYQQHHHPHIETIRVIDNSNSHYHGHHHQPAAQYGAPAIENVVDSYFPHYSEYKAPAPRPVYGVPSAQQQSSYHRSHHSAAARPSFGGSYATRGGYSQPINYPSEESASDFRGYEPFTPSIGETATAPSAGDADSGDYKQLSEGYLPPETLVPPQSHHNSYPAYEDASLAGVGEPDDGGGIGSPLSSWPEPEHKYRAQETYTGIDSYRAAHVQGVGSGGYVYDGAYP